MKVMNLNKTIYLLFILIITSLAISCSNDQNKGLLDKNTETVTVVAPIGTQNCYISGELTEGRYVKMTAIGDNKFQTRIYKVNRQASYKYYSAANEEASECDEFGDEIENRKITGQEDIIASWKTEPLAGVVYNVTVPSETIECYIAGEFTGWRQVQMQQASNQLDKFTIHIENASEEQGYKYCSGPEWEFEELGADNNPIDDRTYTKNDVVFQWRDVYIPGQSKPYTYIETPISLAPYLEGNRRIWVYLPSDYNENLNKKYPVFYMQDGQNIFENGGYGSWSMHKAMQQLESEGFETGIIVAINNSNDRLQEYAPFAHAKYAPNPKGTEYIDAIVNNIMPWINENYRTLTGPENTGIGGSSMGGLISYFGAMKYPDIFGKAAVMSPSFWLCRDELTNYVENYDGNINNSKMYFICGDTEGDSDIIPDMEAKFNETLAKGLKNANVELEIVEGGKHNEASWASQIARVYKFLYSN